MAEALGDAECALIEYEVPASCLDEIRLALDADEAVKGELPL